MKFIKGQCVRTNDQGRRYYKDEPRSNVIGTVIEHNGGVVIVKYGPNHEDAFHMHEDCVESAAPSEDEVAAAIQSITNTPRRGA